ncbi:MAG: electron transfer flavoprotein subunit beta/FixA family protein [bacterium]
MKILVPLKQVPDLVEELEVDDSGTQLDFEYLKMKLNEFDDHALEEALLIKESGDAEVTAIAIDGEDVERILFTALAKGADKAVRITGADPRADSRTLGAIFAEAAKSLGADLVLTGVQAPGDLDGQLGPAMAAAMDVPGISVVASVEPSGGVVVLQKEYSGGMMAEFEVELPAVVGVQAARQAPRYAPVSKVRQIQQSATIEEMAATSSQGGKAGKVVRMEPPSRGQGAKMLAGAAEIVEILKEKGVV